TETPVSAGSGTLDKSEVQNIVSQYLQQQKVEEKKKADSKDKKDEWYEVGSDPRMNGKWGINRLTFESPNKDFRAHVGGRFQCYTSSRNLSFLERSSGFEAFLQEFAPGVWMFNTAFDQRVSWAATLDRPNFQVQKGGEYGKGDYALTARIAGLPVYEHDGRCL